jgi:hypothetical protein
MSKVAFLLPVTIKKYQNDLFVNPEGLTSSERLGHLIEQIENLNQLYDDIVIYILDASIQSYADVFQKFAFVKYFFLKEEVHPSTYELMLFPISKFAGEAQMLEWFYDEKEKELLNFSLIFKITEGIIPFKCTTETDDRSKIFVRHKPTTQWVYPSLEWNYLLTTGHDPIKGYCIQAYGFGIDMFQFMKDINSSILHCLKTPVTAYYDPSHLLFYFLTPLHNHIEVCTHWVLCGRNDETKQLEVY